MIFSDSELEDLETPPRYRPGSIESLCRATRFTQDEIKRIYRGFKAECPTGVVREDTFKMIYAQFFPQGGKKVWNCFSFSCIKISSLLFSLWKFPEASQAFKDMLMCLI